MIARISGTIVEKKAPLAWIEIQGLCYELQVSMNTYYQLPEPGQSCMLHTHLLIREDAHILYGFADETEKQFFRHLIKINGVGPKLALSVLSGISVSELASAVQDGDESRLVRIPGIGKKTAQRLIIEIRDRVSNWDDYHPRAANPSNTQDANAPRPARGTAYQDALSALIALGYKESAARKMLSFSAQMDDGTQMNSEQMIKTALKNSLV